MRKKARNTLAAGVLVAVMASSIITGYQRGQSTVVQATNIQAEETGRADAETTGESRGSENVHGTDITPIDNYLASSLTITCPAGAGDGMDLLLRTVVLAMEEYLGVPVIVVNKPGGDFTIDCAVTLQDSNDDNSISVAFSELLGLPYATDVNFDYTDFGPICNFNSTFDTLFINSSASYDTVEEFVEYCRANPNTIRIGNSGIGGVWHILAASFAQEADIEVIRVPFDGDGPAAVAVVGNNVEAVPVSVQEVQTYVEGGMVKVLYSPSPERLPELLDALTGTECGYLAQMTVFRGSSAPEGMSEDVKAMIDAATRYALADGTVQGFMKAQNYTSSYMNADELREMMDRENAVCVEQLKALDIAVK